jgi:hypothetical protein
LRKVSYEDHSLFFYRRFDQAQRSGARGEISTYEDKSSLISFSVLLPLPQKNQKG